MILSEFISFSFVSCYTFPSRILIITNQLVQISSLMIERAGWNEWKIFCVFFIHSFVMKNTWLISMHTSQCFTISPLSYFALFNSPYDLIFIYNLKLSVIVSVSIHFDRDKESRKTTIHHLKLSFNFTIAGWSERPGNTMFAFKLNIHLTTGKMTLMNLSIWNIPRFVGWTGRRELRVFLFNWALRIFSINFRIQNRFICFRGIHESEIHKCVPN